MRILIIQDCLQERLDVFSDIFKQTSNSITIIVRGEHEYPQYADMYDLIFMMGSNASVLSPDQHSWVSKEQKLIQNILSTKVPCIAICFGAQHIAKTLGAKIASYPQTRISLDNIKVMNTSNFLQDIEEYKTLFFHQDYIIWPEHEEVYSHTKDGHVEAFTANGHIWAFQSHIEVVSKSLFLNYCKSHTISADKKEMICSKISTHQNTITKKSKTIIHNIIAEINNSKLSIS